MPNNPEFSMETITPELAEQYLGRNTHNRNLRQRVVDAYASDMDADNWVWNGEGIKFATDGTLLDGQHRLAAIVASGRAIEMLVTRNLPTHTQHTMDTGAKRKFSDVLRLRGEVNSNVLAAAVRGAYVWETAGPFSSTSTPTNSQLLDFLDRYPWIREGVPLFQRAKAHASIPSAVSGPCWWKFTHIDSDDAEDFFARLTSDEDHHAGQPIHTLRRLLISSASNVRGERSSRFLGAVTVKAWNKYRAGEPCSSLRWSPGGAHPEAFPEPK